MRKKSSAFRSVSRPSETGEGMHAVNQLASASAIPGEGMIDDGRPTSDSRNKPGQTSSIGKGIETHSPAVAAWDAAQEIARLGWLLCEGSLRIEKYDFNIYLCPHNVMQISQLARHLVASFKEKERLTSEIRAAWETSNFSQGNQAVHLGKLQALHRRANRVLVACRSRRLAQFEVESDENERDRIELEYYWDDYHRLHDRYCREAMHPARELVERLCKVLVSGIPGEDRLLGIFLLSRHLAEGVYSPSIHESVKLWFPWSGIDLKLMSPVNDTSAIPAEGEHLIVLADVKNAIHFRIFGAGGKKLEDTDDTQLPDKSRAIVELKMQLKDLWSVPHLSWSDKDGVITAVSSIFGHARYYEFVPREPQTGESLVDYHWFLELQQRLEEIGLKTRPPAWSQGVKPVTLRSAGLLSGFEKIKAEVRAELASPDIRGPMKSLESAGQSVVSEVSGTGRTGPQETIPAEELRRLRAIKSRIDPDNLYIGESLPILGMFEQIAIINKRPDGPVLIRGRSGAGKSEIAERIHRDSSRAKKPFRVEQASNSKAADPLIPRGRWTGYGAGHGLPGIPTKGVPGILEDCAGGTIFVDELGALSPDFQVLLLSVLDRVEIPKVAGRGAPIRPDVRLIFATHEDLDDAVAQGTFRLDLLRRICQSTIWVPPLSDRMDDIFHFVQARRQKHPVSFGLLLALLRHSWPGNVRELLNVLDHTLAQTNGEKELLTVEHLRLADPAIVPSVKRLGDEGSAREVLATMASMLKQQGWTKGRGLQARMAGLLGLPASSFHRLLSKHMPELVTTVDRPEPGGQG
jgi:DNA-binding NtrC family response regulator